MEKKINYLSRTFEDIKGELIKFSNMYYPEVADDFNDSSIGAWFIDLVAAVGDDLSYHTDRMYQETNIDSANLKSSVLNQARANGNIGLKIPSKIKQRLLGFPCQSMFSSLPTINSNSDFA